MASTKISDLAIVPEDFKEYVEKLIMERSMFFQSGLVQNVPTFIPAKGSKTSAPAFLGFDGADEVLSDSAALTVNSVGSTNAIAAINFRGKAFGANDLVDMLAGADPLGDLAGKYADYWVRQLNRVALNVAAGAAAGLDAEYGAGSIIKDESLATITADMILDTRQLFGEYSDEAGIFLCHSAVKTKLQKLDLLDEPVVTSVGTRLDTFHGMRVVVDDRLVPATNVYSSYICKPGSMLYSEGIDPSLAIETDRDILAGDDIVTSRKRFIMHPAGASYVGTPAGQSPTNAELATAGGWDAEDANDANRFGVRVLKHLI